MDQVVALGTQSPDIAMALGGKQNTYLSLFLTTLASSDLSLSSTRESFCLFLYLPFSHSVLIHHNGT